MKYNNATNRLPSERRQEAKSVEEMPDNLAMRRRHWSKAPGRMGRMKRSTPNSSHARAGVTPFYEWRQNLVCNPAATYAGLTHAL